MISIISVLFFVFVFSPTLPAPLNPDQLDLDLDSYECLTFVIMVILCIKMLPDESVKYKQNIASSVDLEFPLLYRDYFYIFVSEAKIDSAVL